jgi:predicted PhzF superfamily epimerase YddE/YHI9
MEHEETPMRIPIYQVDAFTREPFRGNPAGVCLLDHPKPAEWMQQVAAEMNVSETVFVVPDASGFTLRWFTPSSEVALCGHATLATAHVLWETGRARGDRPIPFLSASGALGAIRVGDEIELDFPVMPVVACDPPDGLVEALGAAPSFVGSTPPRGVGQERDHLVLFDNESAVRELRPQIQMLRGMPGGVIVTARAASGPYDIVSRYFAPAFGIDEDPATGVAHCALAHFWAPRLGRQAFLAWQASTRGAAIRVELRGARVRLSGHAVTVLRGELLGNEIGS